MKRYTGQKALYEAINRSRAKTKPRSILERLRPKPGKPESPMAEQDLPPQVEPEQVSEQPEEPVARTPVKPRPKWTAGRKARADAEPQAPPEPVREMTPEPAERVEPVVRSRPIEKIGHVAPPSSVQPWLRPRPVQINEGRLEVSVPYYVGIIAGLAALVVVLSAYRLGQASGGRRAATADTPAQSAAGESGTPTNPPARPTTQDTAANNTGGPQPTSPVAASSGQDATPARTQGDNWIVLTRYKKREDLVPVVDHFAKYGIELFILPLDQAPALFAQYGLNASRLPKGSGYLLVTVNAYDNPNDPKTDGYKMVQRIKEVGAKYKAPSGVESFAPNYFSDAYGMKIRD